MLVKLEIRYVYLGPYMNAMNAIMMNGQVTAAFWMTLGEFNIQLARLRKQQTYDSVSNILILPCFLTHVQAQSATNSQGATYKKLWSPSNGVV